MQLRLTRDRVWNKRNHPPTRPALDAADQGWLAAPSDVRFETALSSGGLRVRGVVTLVEPNSLRLPSRSPAERTAMQAGRAAAVADHVGVERLAPCPPVMDVSPADRERDREAARVGRHAALRAALDAIGRVGARGARPLGAFEPCPKVVGHVLAGELRLRHSRSKSQRDRSVGFGVCPRERGCWDGRGGGVSEGLWSPRRLRDPTWPRELSACAPRGQATPLAALGRGAAPSSTERGVRA
jgi:hypothetical protein